MNCDSTVDNTTEREAYEKEPLAFTSDPSLVHATSRLAVPLEHQKESLWINVEIFEQNTMPTTSPLVIYIPGICESAETKTVQNMAQWAKSIGIRLAVVELQGHGLSSGDLADMSTDILVLIRQVLLVVKRIKARLFEERTTIPYLLSGSSFGGTLALYASEYISRRKERQETESADGTSSQYDKEEDIVNDEELWKDFFAQGVLAGVVAVTPAIGVDPEILPPGWMISSLSLLSFTFPKAQLPFTPMEDSSQYDCPPTTTRNFKGRWPLAISKFLLDLTSQIAPNDVAKGRLSLKNIPRVLLLAGGKDLMIPLSSCRALEAQIQAPSKELVVLPKVGHDVLTNAKSMSRALEKLFSAVL